jgi:hypothetical protein
MGALARAHVGEMWYTFQGEDLATRWTQSHQTMMWNPYQVGSYSHDVGHHYNIIWEFNDCRAPISGYAFDKASGPNIHYKLCTIVDECHPWCWEQQGQHHGVAMVFIWWATELTCPLTLPFAHGRHEANWRLNCFAPHVALWNGIGGYHYDQMSLCNN